MSSTHKRTHNDNASPTSPRAAQTDAKRARTAENVTIKNIREAVPALFAEHGDIFSVLDRYDEYTEFKCEGRTTDNWLMFQISGGETIPSTVRDALNAYPIAKYTLYSDDGTPDPTRVKLPPAMCYMFRLSEFDEPE